MFYCLNNEILTVTNEIVVKNWIEIAAHALIVGSSNFTDRWLCQQQSLFISRGPFSW
jgi:hypothetical protein